MRAMRWVLWLCIGIPLVGKADPQILRMAVPFPTGSKGMTDLQQAARVLLKQTEGRVQIKWVEQLDLESEGRAVDGVLWVGSPLALRSPTAAVDSLLLFYRNAEEPARFLEKMKPQMVAELEAQDFVPLAFLDLGFAYLFSVRPLETVETFQASRLWVPSEDPRAWELSEAYGVLRVLLEAPQVRAALQDGRVETVVAPPLGAILMQWHVNIRCGSDRPFLHLLGVLVVRREALAKLEAVDQDRVRAELDVACRAVADDLRQKESEALDVMVQGGAKRVPFGVTPEQKTEWEAWSAQVAERLAGAGVVSSAALGWARE